MDQASQNISVSALIAPGWDGNLEWTDFKRAPAGFEPARVERYVLGLPR